MRHTISAFLVSACTAASLSSACAPVRVGSFTEPRISVHGYRTYTWDDRMPGETGDPRLDNNRFFHERVISAVQRELSRRGFERSRVGTPDLSIRLHVRVEQKIETARSGSASDACRAGDCDASVVDEGTVLLDVSDVHTGRLLWRGWSESSFDGVVASQDALDAAIDRLVAKILERFPLRVGSSQLAGW